MGNKWLRLSILAVMVLVFFLTLVFSGCVEIEPLPEEPFDEPIPEDPGGGL